jgi:hypothetical protein
MQLIQTGSNIPAYSTTMYPNAPTYPSNTSYPNQNPQIIMLNDGTRDTFSSVGCSVFNLICCFGCCLGIPAVIFSCRANDNVNAGRLAEARSDAQIAKILNIVGICVGSAFYIYIIIHSIMYNLNLHLRYHNIQSSF